MIKKLILCGLFLTATYGSELIEPRSSNKVVIFPNPNKEQSDLDILKEWLKKEAGSILITITVGIVGYFTRNHLNSLDAEIKSGSENFQTYIKASDDKFLAYVERADKLFAQTAEKADKHFLAYVEKSDQHFIQALNRINQVEIGIALQDQLNLINKNLKDDKK